MTFVYDRRAGRTIVFAYGNGVELSMPYTQWEALGQPSIVRIDGSRIVAVPVEEE